MKLEHYSKLEANPNIKWRTLLITILAAWLIYEGKQEMGLSLLAGGWATKGE